MRSTTQLAACNPNYVGGDIITGANTERQVLMRPRAALDPYRTGIRGTFICSAASPPGAGAHGMCGYNAAGAALRYLRIAGVDVTTARTGTPPADVARPGNRFSGYRRHHPAEARSPTQSSGSQAAS